MMKTQNSCRLILTIAATMLITGCALKPRQTSRFHSTATDGSNCNCYTCQQDEGSSTAYAATEQQYIEPYQAATMTETETERPLYQLPEQSEPVVSSESFGSFNDSLDMKKVESEPAIINEVQPEDNYLSLDKSEPKLGGDFKAKDIALPSKPAESLDIFESAPESLPAPKAQAKLPAAPAELPVVKIPDPVPVPDLKPIVAPAPKTVITPAPKKIVAPTPKPIAVPKQVVTPKPKSVIESAPSSFQPGKAFKPRKSIVQPLDSSSVERSSGDKIVLRANPVDRNVVYLPPTKSVAQVIVPALQTSFKRQAPGNSLRSLAHTSQPAYQPPTQVAANVVPTAPTPIPMPIAEVQSTPVAQVLPKKIPVRLRAIPMDQRMIQGQRVQVRFSQQPPSQQVSNAVSPQPLPPQQIPMPVRVPEVKVMPPIVQPKLEVADPAPAIILHEHTASADDAAEYATPPWRRQ